MSAAGHGRGRNCRKLLRVSSCLSRRKNGIVDWPVSVCVCVDIGLTRQLVTAAVASFHVRRVAAHPFDSILFQPAHLRRTNDYKWDKQTLTLIWVASDDTFWLEEIWKKILKILTVEDCRAFRRRWQKWRNFWRDLRGIKLVTNRRGK